MMASVALELIPLVLLVPLVSASHYFGGTMGFSYKGNSDGSFQVSFRNRGTYDGCDDHYWSCSGGDCGTLTGRKRTIIDSSNNAPSNQGSWCETETIETRNVSTDKPFELGISSCCWVSTRNSVSAMKMRTLVDLGLRSDTQKPNNPPDVATLPFLRIPQNCPRPYQLMSFDPDSDTVRCRYGNSLNSECSTCDRPAGFLLDEKKCTLSFNSSTANSNVYGFEMVVEDFPKGYINLFYSDGSQATRDPLMVRLRRQVVVATSPPLSKLPLQFSFYVDAPAPSCTEGIYLPQLVNPTPANGARLQAEVNKELEILVIARATQSQIQDLIMSGPTNITMHQNAPGEFSIKWMPMPHDLGEYFPICFAVESTAGSAVYQSEMRCVMLEVVEGEILAHVTCGETTMRVEVQRESLHGLSEDHLRLSDPTNLACDLSTHSNSSHIIAVIPLNSCGTQIEEDDNNLIFKNEITLVDDQMQLITRKRRMEALFYCQYAKKGNVSLSFIAHRKNVTVWEKGFGTFTYLEFYPNSHFQNMFNPALYPLDYDLGSKIFMQIDSSSTLNNTVMFVESCSAAPYDNPNYSPTYSIINNGCAVDPTVETYQLRNGNQFRFSIEAFKFIGVFDQVYISCSVMMCEAGNLDTRCAQGCMDPSTTPIQANHLHKREAVLQSGRHFVSQGPLRLKRSTDSSSSLIDLNLVFMAGCVLAAMGMICGVVILKAKAFRVGYEPLSSLKS